MICICSSVGNSASSRWAATCRPHPTSAFTDSMGDVGVEGFEIHLLRLVIKAEGAFIGNYGDRTASEEPSFSPRTGALNVAGGGDVLYPIYKLPLPPPS